ncbi:phage tail tape measure protein [Leisingera sp. MMG026]|uniref:phage tail tape measure protein n=1 Tax=Leisingera sp. MMG026 TaxID=2909982 RepID=UPI001F022923|nr:phage tail tape measure protein [Leisingera sp. MMG026]MCF6432509.1 phage tail tape measure protein [Leisingera sp. MMG026]
MTRGLDVSVFVKMAADLAKPLKDAEGKIKDSTDRMRKSMSLSLKLGGAGLAATGLKIATNKIISDFTQSSKEIQRASGDLRALGMKDIQAVVREGRRLQNTYVGLTTEAFVRAAYDIRSGVSSLTDEGVAAMTASALTVAKATKGMPESMTSLFATSYGIFKKQFAEISDADWGDMFGAALAKSVQQFKTDGAKMQQAIESAGAGATNLGMKMTEQMALLGMMQQQMQAGEAGTALKAFASNAYRADQAFAKLSKTTGNPVRVRLIDEQGQLRQMPEILTDLKERYGQTLEAAEAAEIGKAFGTEEAMKLINALYGQEAAVRANVVALEEAAQKGAEFTEAMAAKTDDYAGAKWEVFRQNIKSIKEEIGEGLAPAMDALAAPMGRVAQIVSGFIQNNPTLVAGFGSIVVGLFGLATVAAPVLFTASSLVTTFAALRHGSLLLGVALAGSGTKTGLLARGIKVLTGAFGFLRIAVMGLGRALLANPIGLAVAAIAGGAYLIYRNWEPIKAFFQRLWAGVKAFTANGWENIKSIFFNYTPHGLIITHWEGITAWFGALWGKVKSGVSTAWDGIKAGFFKYHPAGLVYTHWDGISAWFGTLWEGVKTTFATKWSEIKAALNPLSWSGLVKSEDLASAWRNITGVLGGKLGTLWDALSPLSWTGLVKSEDLAKTLKSAASVVTETASSIWNGITSIDWGNIIFAPNWSRWLSFSWADVLPDWDWGAIIPELPDLKGMFTDAGETIDVRLENRASNMVGREWREGLDLIAQYRQGLTGIEEVKSRLEAKVASESGAMFDSFEVNRAQDMLALLQELDGAPAELPEIKNPETLKEAARAAEALTKQFPVLTAAALETQTAVAASMARIIADLQATSLASEGQRLMQSLAEGIRSQIAQVTSATQEITAAIRNALPKTAHLKLDVPGGAIPKVQATNIQARARGGNYSPGWLLTGEEGPEMRYENKGGFIAHNRALRGMLDMAGRARSLISGLDLGSFAKGFNLDGIAKGGIGAIGASAITSAMASAAAGPQAGELDFQRISAQMNGLGKQVTVTMNPSYTIPITGEVSSDMETRLRQILEEHTREAKQQLESLFDD